MNAPANWTDPDSQWQRDQRRRVAPAAMVVFLWLVIAAVGVPVLVILVAGSQAWNQPVLETGMPLMLPGVLVFTMLLLLRTAVLERQVLDRVPKHDGALCVRCRRPLPPAARAAPTTPMACGRCATVQSVAQARAAWEGYPWSGGRIGRATLRDAEPGASATDRAPAWLGSNRQLLLLPPAAIASVGGMVVLVSLIKGEFIVGRLIQQVPTIMSLAGMLTVVCGLFARRGRSRHCALCTHQMPPSGVVERCPECGASWNATGGHVRGRQAPRPVVITIGAFFGMAGLTLQFGGHDVMERITPTSVIVGNIITGTERSHRHWAELQTRSLNAAQADRLLGGLLERLEESEHVRTEGHAWIQARVQAGEATPEHVARYAGASMTVASVEPARAVAGGAMSLTLELHRPPGRQLARAGSWGLLVGDVVLIGPDGSPAGPSLAGEAAFRRLPSFNSSPLSAHLIRLELGGLRPQVAGPHRVRIELHRAILPPATGPIPVTRDTRGTISVPPGVLWSERMLVEHSIDVEAGGEQ